MERYFPDEPLTIIYGAMADKDISGMYSHIVPMSDIFYTTTPNNSRSMPKEQLAEKIELLGAKAKACCDFEDAIERALERAGENGVVWLHDGLRYACGKVAQR